MDQVIKTMEAKGATIIHFTLPEYDTLSSKEFYKLKGNLSKEEKISALQFLNSVNNFSSEKSIFQKGRYDMYLQSGFENSFFLLKDYENTTAYLDSVSKSADMNAGLVFNNFPEYPLLAMLRDLRTAKIHCRNISYLEVFLENKNYTEKYFYNTIVTNDKTFHGLLNPADIRQIRTFGMITVIRLQNPSAKKYKLDKSGKF